MEDLRNLFVCAGIGWKGLEFRSLPTVIREQVVENCGAGKDLSSTVIREQVVENCGAGKDLSVKKLCCNRFSSVTQCASAA